MGKYYILVTECMDPYYGDNGDIFDDYNIAKEQFDLYKKRNKWAQLYEADLLENFEGRKSIF